MKCRLGIVVIISCLGDSSEERKIEVVYSESIRLSNYIVSHVSSSSMLVWSFHTNSALFWGLVLPSMLERSCFS
jgi:hypothetical protein